MKKALLLFLLGTTPAVYNVTAQPKSQSTKNSDKSITVSVKGIEYDNPAFDDLRKSIKGNMKVKQSNPAFTGDVATIILSYQGTATELWDELPQSSKQNFKIIAIDGNRIELQLKTNNTQTVSKTTETKKEDCIDCHYYKSCYDDTSVVFDGNVYKGSKKRKTFYFCKNGTLYSKTVSKDKVFSQIIFKANEPVGTNWIDTFGSITINKTIISKAVGIMHGKTYYDDVLLVHFADNSLTANYYYAKGSGFIKYDSVDKAFNPAIASKIKGNIDTTLIGIWKYYNPVNKTNYYYKFNGDGSFAFYSGIIHKEAQMPHGTSIWRASSNYIELYNGAWSSVSQVLYQKKSDPITGKPAIAFGSGNHFVYYISDDGKPAWK